MPGTPLADRFPLPDRFPLADWLQSLDDLALAGLLRARPDLAVPTPADTSVLATRATIRASMARACEDLDAFTLTVLEALVLAEADRAPVTLTRLGTLLGPEVAARRTAAAVRTLRQRLLAWGGDEAITIAPTARDVVPAFPGGLGRVSPTLNDTDLATLLGGLDGAQLSLLRTLAQGPPIGRTRAAANSADPHTPVQRLLAAGLLLRRDQETVELPRQVALALRGNHPMGPVPLAEPPLPSTPNAPSTVDSAATSAVLDLLRHTENLISLWSDEPAPVLRAGGLGVRECRRVAKHTDLAEPAATLVIELAAAAGLVAASDGVDPEWTPTTAADVWLAQPPAQRWATLAEAWLDLPRLPGLAGTRDDRDRPLAVLSEDLRRPPAARDRRWILDALAQLPPGTGISDPDGLVAVLAWRAPRRGGRLRAELVEWAVREGTAVGVLALGALTTAGRALLANTDPVRDQADDQGGRVSAAAAMAAALPQPVDHVLVQADLSVIAPGPLQPALARELALVADVESAGAATVYRVTEATIRRALDAGRGASELHEFFGTRSATPVPQALSYLVDDVARRHGRLRAAAAGSVLRCDDEALIAEVLADRRTVSAQLRRVAATVLISPRPLAELLQTLRAAGYAPVGEGPAGQVLDLRPSGHRVPARPKISRGVPLAAVDADRAAQLVRQLRGGDAAAAARRGPAVYADSTPTSTAATMALLREATNRRIGVCIGYVDAHGVATLRIVEPIGVGAGMLEGLDLTDGAVRNFSLHRITSAAMVQD